MSEKNQNETSEKNRTNEIKIYHAEKGEVVFDVDATADTIWATEEQIAKLFSVDRSVINRHVRNVYRDGELSEDETSKKSAELRREGEREVRRTVRRFNLDMIISVGYRVNSKKATEFRIWATKVLKQYATTGAVIDPDKIAKLSGKKAEAVLSDFQQAMGIVKRLVENSQLTLPEANGVLEVISHYMRSFQTISEFSDGHFSLITDGREKSELTAGEIEQLVKNLRTSLNERQAFGQVSEENLAIEAADLMDLTAAMTAEFSDDDTVASKAAKMLYFVVKRRPFADGNKRIGALLFIVYLTKNDFSLTCHGETKISDRALTALVLLIAESEPAEKELILQLIQKLLED